MNLFEDAEKFASGANSHGRLDSVHVVSSDFEDLLTGCLERFAEAGPVQSASQLRAWLPEAESYRQFVLVELIKMDMAMMAEGGQIRLIDFYVSELPAELTETCIPLDLVMEEIQLRKQLGQLASREEYARRFPQFESMLEHLHETKEATLARHQVKPPPVYEANSKVDDFLISMQLGKGAFATVYLAMQLSMQRPVALKVSRSQGDESRSLARFDHSNIVRIYDQRDLPGEDVHLLYMQFLPGGTLADVVSAVRGQAVTGGKTLLTTVDKHLLRSMQSVPESSATRCWLESAAWAEVVAWIGTQLASALQHAHSHGVLHRDVKPANVLLTADCIPKLADFNVSFAGAAGRAGAAASFGGSIGYMSPEHLRAIQSTHPLMTEKVAETADLFSLGILLWELWQGCRPFQVDKHVESWSDAIDQQLVSRSAELLQPVRARDAAERALESTLRRVLAYQPADRPQSGGEFAGRLRLTLHPDAAWLFDIQESPLRLFVLNQSPWLVAIVLILTPNIIGGFLNYQYNYHQVMTESMRQGLERLSWFINLFFFPLGAAIIVYYALTLIRAVRAAKLGQVVTSKDIRDTLRLGHRAAVIGGSLWLIGGVAIPCALSLMVPDFTFSQAVHLLISSLICGGVAMIYPFFGMIAVSTWVYYPLYINATMQDRGFAEHRRWIIRHSEAYLLVAALIPLFGAALTSWNGAAKAFTLVAIGAGVIGLLASFFVQRSIVKAWSQMAEVLNTPSAGGR